MNPLEMTQLPHAAVKQRAGQPHASAYDDVYFNDINGLAESQYVFIAGNQLPSQWQNSPQKDCFCIAETGFGSGLNFLATCLAWQQTDHHPQHLHFISTELHPMKVTDMESAHELFPELSELSQSLLTQLHSTRAGLHRYDISHDISLTLMLGDAQASLGQLNAQVDAWFLDGFAPPRNPAMWSKSLFQTIAKMSRPGATLATYTAASQIRKDLTAAGFEMTKRPGFGPKRDMLIGQLQQPESTQTNKQLWHPIPNAQFKQKQISIIGGGIAGLSLARSFKRQGYHTTVIDQQAHPMQNASGNSHAMVMPALTAQVSPEALFYWRAFEYACQAYESTTFKQVGVTAYCQANHALLSTINSNPNRFPESLVHAQEQSLRYPSSGFLNTCELAAQWMPYVDQWLQADVDHIEHDVCWQLLDKHHQVIHSCEVLIVAAGMKSQQLIHQQDLSLTAKSGQTTLVTEVAPLKLNQVQLNKGYIIPINEKNTNTSYLLGATFDHVSAENTYANANELSHQSDLSARNLAVWQYQDFYKKLLAGHAKESHTAIRATTADHLPVCGPVINQKQFELDYADLHHGRHWQSYPTAAIIPNLYVMSGLGSRGFTSAPLLAEYLMSMITAQPLPLESDLCKIIHPNRFNYRRLKKTKK